MTKTENYNLPQWAANDPLRREDFNGAMESIDAGLVNDRAAALTQMEAINYNLLQMMMKTRQEGWELPTMQGLCCNMLATDVERNKASQYEVGEDGGIVVGQGTSLTMEKLNTKATEFGDLTLESASSSGAAYAVFETTQPGTITSIRLWFSRTTNYFNGAMNLQVFLYDLTTQTCTYTSQPMTLDNLYAAETVEVLAVSIPLEAKRKYRLEVYKSGSVGWMGTMGLGVKGASSLLGTMAHAPLLTSTVTETLPLAQPGRSGTAVVRHSGNGTLEVRMGEQLMPVVAAKTATTLNGLTCTETVYRLSGELTGNVPVAVTISATEAQNMTLYEFGAALL